MRCGEIQIGGNSFRKIRYVLEKSLFVFTKSLNFCENCYFQKRASILRKNEGRIQGMWIICIFSISEFMFLREFDVSEVPG